MLSIGFVINTVMRAFYLKKELVLVYITFGYDDYVNSQDSFVPEVGECDCLAE